MNKEIKYLSSVLNSIEEKTTEEIDVYKMNKNTSIDNFTVIVSVSSKRQSQAIANNIIDNIKKDKKYNYLVEGFDSGEWIIVNWEGIIVHIFVNELRNFYQIDDIFKNEEKLSL